MIGKYNPLNVRYNPLNRWIGQTGYTRGFCDFTGLKYCIRAVAYLIMISYRKKGIKTYSEIINRYAPVSENNTSLYLDFICKKLGVFPFDIPESYFDVGYLIYYMSYFEGDFLKKFGFSPKDIERIIINFNLKFYEKS